MRILIVRLAIFCSTCKISLDIFEIHIYNSIYNLKPLKDNDGNKI